MSKSETAAVGEKKAAANRWNAAKSTGPRNRAMTGPDELDSRNRHSIFAYAVSACQSRKAESEVETASLALVFAGA